MAGTLKQDDTEIELRSPDRRRKMAVVDPNGLTSMEIQEYKDVFEVLSWGDLESGVIVIRGWGGRGERCWLSILFHCNLAYIYESECLENKKKPEFQSNVGIKAASSAILNVYCYCCLYFRDLTRTEVAASVWQN